MVVWGISGYLTTARRPAGLTAGWRLLPTGCTTPLAGAGLRTIAQPASSSFPLRPATVR